MVYEPLENSAGTSPTYGKHFLNVTFRDVVSTKTSSSCNALASRPVTGPAWTLSLHPTTIGQDALFLSYCKRVTQIQHEILTAYLQ
jgi:hypothetical protein